MAFAKQRQKKDGTTFYEIRAYSKEKKQHYTKYYYPPLGWSARAIKKQLQTEIEAFQVAVDAGEVLSKAEKKEREEAAAAEKALLKTVKQYAESVFMPKKELSIAENTRLSYWSNLNEHIFPVFGDCLIKDVTTAMINGMLSDFQKTHSYGSTIKVYNICNGLFGMAFRDETISINPMFKVERPEQGKDEKAVTEADKALFEDELLHVLDCVALEPLKWQAFLHLAADTGCRRGELCGLQWSDINLDKGIVNIKRNLQYSKEKKVDDSSKKLTVVYDGVYYVSPKGGKLRTVDIGKDTVAILTAYKASLTKADDEEETEDEAVINLNEYRKKKEKKPLPKWVFTKDGEDAPMFPTSPTRYFSSFGERYNIPGFHPHLLRHTSASLSLTNGSDAKSVADRLGHKDASILLKVYAHANDDSIRAAGQAARDALERKREEQKKKAKKENAGA